MKDGSINSWASTKIQGSTLKKGQVVIRGKKLLTNYIAVSTTKDLNMISLFKSLTK